MPHSLRLPRPARLFSPLLLSAAALVLAGCGSSGPGTSPEPPSPSASTSASPSGSSPAASPGTPAVAATSLTVELMAQGEAVTDTWTLECDGAEPVGASGAPDPAGACAALAGSGTALMAEPGPNVSCTMQYGGPQRATVTGTVNGEAVDAAFAMSNGCEISRWEALKGLLGAGAGGL